MSDKNKWDEAFEKFPVQIPSHVSDSEPDEIIDVEAYNTPRQNIMEIGGGFLGLVGLLGPLLLLSIPAGAVWLLYYFLTHYSELRP